ncbi:MAG: dihydroneopterin aldolase family protein [Thermoplasmata archaeon]|nr:dihydroneopterin aldolase family protein [Thermoplasmata archaeon]
MRIEREKIAEGYFKCTDSERAAFEAGIKLGTVYHQFVGTPISIENVELLENAIAEGTKIQPFVYDAEVHISRDVLRSKKSEFDYISLTGDMMNVSLIVDFKGVRVFAKMKFVPEMNYPLMFIEKVEKK